MQLSKRQISQVARVAKQVLYKESETKMVPFEVQNQLIGPDDTCYYATLSSVWGAQGPDNEARVGDKAKGIGMQMVYSIGQVTASRRYFVRVIALKAEGGEFNSTTATILTNTSNVQLAPTANDSMDILRSLNRKSIKVLYDRTHKTEIPGVAGDSNYGNMIYVKKFFKLRDQLTWTTDSSAADTLENNIRFFVIVRDSQGGTVTAGEDINFNLFCRYYYKDF